MRGLAFADWLVNKSSGVLGARVSRRGFISKTTLVGTAVAATGCAVVTQPGAPYERITNCGRGALCRDGYTEFCCVINNGVNACPPGSIASGWWRADYSIFCDGTRYYIDCNDFSGYAPCGCGAGCDTRKVYCNHFRYGQCSPWIGGTGVIACRMVTCIPPFLLDLGCGFSGAVDNATAGHFTDCTPYTPPPPPPPPLIGAPVLPALGSVLALAAGTVDLFVRGSDGKVWQEHFDGSAWSAWQALDGTVRSAVLSASPAAGEIALSVRAGDRSLAVRRFAASAWGSWEPLGGLLTSDAAVGILGSTIHVVGRGDDNGLHTRRFNGATWSQWEGLGGVASSDPELVPFNGKLHLFVRGSDGGTAEKVFTSSWSGWQALGGVASSDVAVAATPSELHAIVRGTDNHIYERRTTGGAYTGWEAVGSFSAISDPVAVADGSDVSVFARGTDNSLWHIRRTGSAWGAWASLGLPVVSDPVATADSTGLWVFAQGTDNGVQYARLQSGSWSAWAPLPGLTVAPVTGNS